MADHDIPAGAAPARWTGRRVVVVAVALLALPLCVFFGLRTYGSFTLLRSAYELGAPATSGIRAWMTLDYVAEAWRVPRAELIARLDLPAATDLSTSLKSLADRSGLAARDYAQIVQRVVVASTNGRLLPQDQESSGGLTDAVLTALLLYGYPILGLVALFGSIGLPLPDGIATSVAGALIEQGKMSWLGAGITVFTTSLLGDAAGYAIGFFWGREFLARHGKWVGYTAARRMRAERLFARWGAATVLASRTVLSYLSSVVSFLAGAHGYGLRGFLAYSGAGRLLWSASYLALGYAVGPDPEAALGFLVNLGALLALLLVGAIAAQLAFAGALRPLGQP